MAAIGSESLVGGKGADNFKIDVGSPLWRHTTRISQFSGAWKKNLRLIDVDVPAIGGHAGITILPLLSKIRPLVTFSQGEVEELILRIQNAGTEVVEAKAGAGSATLSMAYAAARFVESSLRALDGDPDVFDSLYVHVQSALTELLFFASRVNM